jgi:hypothetical protein
MNVGDVRKATEGLPDEAQVRLHVHLIDEDEVLDVSCLSLVQIYRDDDGLAVTIEVDEVDEDDEDEDDWEDDE